MANELAGRLDDRMVGQKRFRLKVRETHIVEYETIAPTVEEAIEDLETLEKKLIHMTVFAGTELETIKVISAGELSTINDVEIPN